MEKAREGIAFLVECWTMREHREHAHFFRALSIPFFLPEVEPHEYCYMFKNSSSEYIVQNLVM